MEEVKSDSELQAQYIARNPVSRVIQCAAVQSENEVSAGTHIQKMSFCNKLYVVADQYN